MTCDDFVILFANLLLFYLYSCFTTTAMSLSPILSLKHHLDPLQSLVFYLHMHEMFGMTRMFKLKSP